MLDLIFYVYDYSLLLINFSSMTSFFSINLIFYITPITTWPMLIYVQTYWFVTLIIHYFLICIFIGFLYFSHFYLFYYKQFDFYLLTQFTMFLNLTNNAGILNFFVFGEYICTLIFSFFFIDICWCENWTILNKIFYENCFYLLITHGYDFLIFYNNTVFMTLITYISNFIQENLIQINFWLRLCLIIARFVCYQIFDDIWCLIETTTTINVVMISHSTFFSIFYLYIYKYFIIFFKFIFELDMIFKFFLLLNISYILLLILQRFTIIETRVVA